MTREERKQALDWFNSRSKSVTMPGAKRMYLLAIEALSAEKTQLSGEDATKDATFDTISRKQAIDALWKIKDERDSVYYTSAIHISIDAIEQLPSAEQEIIRCKDCKWWDKKEGSRSGYCHAIKHGYYTSHWEISIHRKYEENFYCADAERREHE